MTRRCNCGMDGVMSVLFFFISQSRGLSAISGMTKRDHQRLSLVSRQGSRVEANVRSCASGFTFFSFVTCALAITVLWTGFSYYYFVLLIYGLPLPSPLKDATRDKATGPCWIPRASMIPWPCFPKQLSDIPMSRLCLDGDKDVFC